MPSWHGKSKGTPLGYWIFVFICKNLGLFPAYIVLRFVALYYLFFSWSSTRNSYNYFRLRQGYGPIESFLSVYRNYYIFGQTLLDKVVVMAGIENNFSYDFEGEENLRMIVEAGQGGILLSAHVGNWEAAGHLLRRLKTRINIVMFDGEHQQIKDFLESVTGGRNLNVILIRPNMAHVFEMGEALQKNELICLHADRFMEGNKTTMKNFLGADAQFPIGPFLLSASFRVPVSVVFAFKESRSHYHFYGSRLLVRENQEQKNDFMNRLLSTFVNELEQKVRLYPDQWFNYYNFWGK